MVGRQKEENLPAPIIAKRWAEFSAARQGKVVFARPPAMFYLDLASGRERKIAGVTTAGGPGRGMRGKTPRPSWSPDGTKFAYRFANRIYVCDLQGNKRQVTNAMMDCSDETRWSWHRHQAGDWLAGPSVARNVILVKIDDSTVVKTVYGGGDVEKHCEITGTGRYVVYDDGARIRVAPFGSRTPGRPVSRGQSCRPCAAADDRVAWLPTPHDRYRIFGAADGRFRKDLLAPPGEEIYRLNWSNLPDLAVHMFGSDGITRMHVRKIDSGASLFIGCGWDPDLWVAP